MRGKPRSNLPNVYTDGITPAGAGKTFRSKFSPREIQDHPRRCGENLPPKNETERTPGSPPQVRGKPGVILIKVFCQRITPAGAGKTVHKITH